MLARRLRTVRPMANTDPRPVPRLVILGGGFAGVFAAVSAAGAAASYGPVDIDLVTPDDRFVPRIRLHEANPRSTTVALADLLAPIGVRHVQAEATAIDPWSSTVELSADGDATLGYDRLIVATGSRLRTPPIDTTHFHDIDTLASSEALDRRIAELPSGATIAVIGAGFTDVELACELPTRAPGCKVVLVDRSEHPGAALGDDARPHIRAALDELDVTVLSGRTVVGFDGATLQLSGDEHLAADVAVWTGGVEASPLTEALSSDLDTLGRLPVDQFLRVDGLTGVFAAGDTAAPLDESGHTVTQSAQHAIPQGLCAGHNAVADLAGATLTELQTLPYGTCLDLGSAGAVYTEGWDRDVVLVGQEAKALKEAITTTWIYPPVGDPVA